MSRLLKKLLGLVVLLCLLAALGAAAWVFSKRPQRDGMVTLERMSAPVSVRYDEAGVPHLKAESENDLYRALGYVHAQDRLFQMEMARRLARGELAEILGPKLVPIDRLFRTLGIRAHADERAAKLDAAQPATQALLAYLDGVNQYQASRVAPLEFDLLGIPKRPFTAADTLSVAGYLAYSFAAAFRTEPVMTRIRDELGADHLKPFGLAAAVPAASAPLLSTQNARTVGRLAELSAAVEQVSGVALFEGSNAWAVAGQRTASGKALLAGDMHIAFSVPAVWYEAHLSAPGFELYGHHQALNPLALVGHSPAHAWTLTMFQNDDIDLVAEKVNPANPNQVWIKGQWVELQSREELIQVKGAAPVPLTLRRSPHGPIINDALEEGSVGVGGAAGRAPIAMWWAFLNTDNPLLDAFHELNRAHTLPQARAAAAKIHAPGLNVVWANTAGDIAWWAAARLPERAPGVRPEFILDGSTAEADKPGFLPFSANPQEENPPRGYLVSANHQPGTEAPAQVPPPPALASASAPTVPVAAPASAAPTASPPVPGYYNLPDRAARIEAQLQAPGVAWTAENSRALQLDTRSDYGPRLLRRIVPLLRPRLTDPAELAQLEQLAGWQGEHELDGVAPTLFNQLLFETARAAMADELGPASFAQLLRTRALDHALPRLVDDPASPWWDIVGTPARESRDDIMLAAWQATLKHLRATFGVDSARWTWGRAHTVTHSHPLGRQAPLDKLFNVGPFAVPGGRETPNNLAFPVGPAPWAVNYGPSTRRIVDLGAPGEALGINPVGQSGVWLDRHYADQAQDYVAGRYRPQHLLPAAVKAHAQSLLLLRPR